MITNSTYALTRGSFGLILLHQTRLVGSRIARLKLFLKRATRKPDKTRRFSWLNCFPHLPLTKKAVGLRMGKGKGKLDRWFTTIRGGTTLLQFQNLRPGRALRFAKQVTNKIGVLAAFRRHRGATVHLPFKRARYASSRRFNEEKNA